MAEHDVPLREYLERLMDEADKRYQQRFEAQSLGVNTALLAAKEAVGAALQAAKEAVAKAEAASERRFEGVNEFRKSLNDMQTTLMPRNEADRAMSAMNDKLAMLSSRMDKAEGAGGGLKAGWGYLIGAVGLAGAVVSFFASRT